MPKFTKHIFVCMNQREPSHPRPCCDPSGQGELQRLFKTKLAERGIKLGAVGDKILFEEGVVGVVLARYLRSGDLRHDVHYIVELRREADDH